MKRYEVVAVLTKAAAYDNRTIGDADVAAWFEILERVNYEFALEAVRRHYAESTTRIMPADVVRLSRVVRDERDRLEHRHGIRALPSRFEEDPARDAVNGPGAARVQQMINQILAKRAVDGSEAFEATPIKSMKDVAGAWWEDPKKREAHAVRLLAESGRLHQHCQEPACQMCSSCPCADIAKRNGE